MFTCPGAGGWKEDKWVQPGWGFGRRAQPREGVKMLGSPQGRHDVQEGRVRVVVGTQGSMVSVLQGELGFDVG